MQMLNRYLAIELGVQAPGWDWTYKRGGSQHTDKMSSHETGENNGERKAKRRAPSLSSGLFQCLEVGVIRRIQQKQSES